MSKYLGYFIFIFYSFSYVLYKLKLYNILEIYLRNIDMSQMYSAFMVE